MQEKVGPVEGLVSIVIAAYNAEDYIAETLESILSQTYPALELIVVDDGSKDSTAAVVAGFGDRVRLIQLQNTGGPSLPRNVGARHARGKYLVFFDADDLMTADRVETQVRFFRAHPLARLVVSNYRNFTTQGEYSTTHFDTCTNLQRLTSHFREPMLSAAQAQDALLIENFGCTCACMFNRSAFEEAGGFDAGLFVGEDYDLIYRMARSGPIGVLPQLGFLRRLHDHNVSNRTEYNLRQKIRTRRKMLSEERDAGRARALRLQVGELHADLFQHLSRESPAEALHHLWNAVQARSPVVNIRTLKGLVKVLIASVSAPKRKVARGIL